MSGWQEAELILGMMLVTFGIRFPVLALAGRVELPEVLVKALRYVPIAVLTAICVPLILKPDGVLFISLSNAHLVAGIVSIIVAAVGRRLLRTIIIGMLIFFLLRLFG